MSETRGGGFTYGTPDGYRFFLDAGTVANINEKYFNYSVPTWNEYMEHPNYDEYWERQNPLKHAKNITHAVLNVAGWFDAEDFYGPLETYKAVERTPGNRNRIVIGPWLHGGWASMTGDVLGDIRFGSNTAEYYRNEIELPFFRYHLKGQGTEPTTEATMFETGGNAWRTFQTWPPKNLDPRTLYFQADGGLSFTAPPSTSVRAGGFDEYVSDPAKPVPWSTETRTTQGHLWMVEDQRFAAARPDVLVYRTEPLKEDVVIAGPIFAAIFASTTGTDADWIVKLIDVYPGDAPDNNPNPRGIRMGDFQMLLAGEVFRAAVPQFICEARAARAESGGEVPVRSARPVPPVPERPPHHGAGAKHVVPGHRPESTDVRRHLQGEAVGLPQGHAPRLPHAPATVGREGGRREVVRPGRRIGVGGGRCGGSRVKQVEMSSRKVPIVPMMVVATALLTGAGPFHPPHRLK